MGIRGGAGVEMRWRLTEEISNYERMTLHLLVHCDIQKAEVNTQKRSENAWDVSQPSDKGDLELYNSYVI
jgi:hypothetical protein